MTAQSDALRREVADGMRRLAEWAAAAETRRPPNDVRRRAAVVLADDIGAMVIASAEPQVKRLQKSAARGGHAGPATVFAPGSARVDKLTAAYANGLAATWCEMDEGFRLAPCHAGAYVLPALLAEAETRGSSVGEVLEAIAIAYEATTRLAQAFPFETISVHPHAAFSPFGAATAVSLIRRHDAQTLLDSMTGAISMAMAGHLSHAVEGALIRNAWAGAGAWLGFRAVEWAEAGMRGLPTAPYDVLTGSFRAGVDPAALTEGLGERWGIQSGYHKVFACCQYAHSAVEASLALRDETGADFAPQRLVEIVVETHPRALALTTVEPDTVLAAKFSLPHAVAAAAFYGTGGQTAFSERSLSEPAVADLRRRVRLVPYADIGAWPNDRPARITWRFGDGGTRAAVCESARGGSDRPIEEAELAEKLRTNTVEAFPSMHVALSSIIDGGADVFSSTWADMVAVMVRGRSKK
jgi:2-methylcitrate dehydratase PrpD